MSVYERELITSLLTQNHYNLAKTAEQLKLSRHALRYRMQRLNIADHEGDGEVTAGTAKVESA